MCVCGGGGLSALIKEWPQLFSSWVPTPWALFYVVFSHFSAMFGTPQKPPIGLLLILQPEKSWVKQPILLVNYRSPIRAIENGLRYLPLRGKLSTLLLPGHCECLPIPALCVLWLPAYSAKAPESWGCEFARAGGLDLVIVIGYNIRPRSQCRWS